MGRVLVTGAAGFVGHHVAKALLARGEAVLGVDDYSGLYDPALKRLRQEALGRPAGYEFLELDIADPAAVVRLADPGLGLDRIVHLAAQAGVRASLEQPFAYTRSNIEGQLVLLELARALGPRLGHLVYASSSSVYGRSETAPFAETQRADRPVSLYAATKRGGELMAEAYASLFDLPLTGLRFFTVYGAWGRPDMAYWKFTESILAGRAIPLFDAARQARDFTFVEDALTGILAALDRPPGEGAPRHRVYNLGNDRPVSLADFLAAIEGACGRRAEVEHLGPQPGDVERTWADLTAARRDLGYDPKTPIEEGLRRFVEWFREAGMAEHGFAARVGAASAGRKNPIAVAR